MQDLEIAFFHTHSFYQGLHICRFLRRRQRREEERRLGLARGTYCLLSPYDCTLRFFLRLTPANDKPKTCNTWKKGRGGKSTKKESERRRLRRRKFEEILGLPRGAAYEWSSLLLCACLPALPWRAAHAARAPAASAPLRARAQSPCSAAIQCWPSCFMPSALATCGSRERAA